MELTALLINFDLTTGGRAGGIDPHDPHLQCYGWQDLASTPAREIRLIEDDRDITKYEGIPGVKVLKGKTAINQAINTVRPPRYNVEDQILFSEDLRQRGIVLSTYAGKSQQEILADLSSKGLIGIGKDVVRKV